MDIIDYNLQMNIFSYTSYKNYVNEWVVHQPNAGRGQLRKIAHALQISTTLVSQIFRGDRDLSSEQAFLLGRYLRLTDNEIDYFCLLVAHDRCGLREQKEYLEIKLTNLRRESSNLKNHLPSDTILTEEQKNKYYSDWVHGAIRVLAEIPALGSSEKLASHLNIDETRVRESLNLLQDMGLIEQLNGKVRGLGRTLHREKGSPHHLFRQQTWRVKGMQKLFNRRPHDELFFNALMALTRVDRDQLLELLNDSLKKMNRIALSSQTPEVVYCLNIDYFEL